MMRSYLLAGFLAALCSPSYGLVFVDTVKQEVFGDTLSLLHDVGDSNSVSFGIPPNPQSEAWKFDTTGHKDDEAIITDPESGSTLVCEEGNKCRMDPEGSEQVFRVTLVEGKHIFTFQDLETELYVERTSDLDLALTEEQSDLGRFTLQGVNK